MTLTRRSLFASAVALLALPRRIAAEKLLTAPSAPGHPLDGGGPWSNRLAPPPFGPEAIEAMTRAMARAARESADALIYAILVSRQP